MKCKKCETQIPEDKEIQYCDKCIANAPFDMDLLTELAQHISEQKQREKESEF